jgi:ABC-type lipoprotein release transport system permease subunit
VRAALGAGRGRLIVQFLTESLVLAGLGAVAGLALAVAAMRFLEPRPVLPAGRIVTTPEVGGLHHRYDRIAA